MNERDMTKEEAIRTRDTGVMHRWNMAQGGKDSDGNCPAPGGHIGAGTGRLTGGRCCICLGKVSR